MGIGDNNSLPVVIAGGGWAGLAAAVELSAAGIPVLVLESARQLGGRARGVRFGKLPVDNGQHLLIGAYHETLRLLALIGQREEDVLLRLPLQLHVRGPSSAIDLKTSSHLPAPLHLGWGLLSARGLPLRDRWRAMAMSLQLRLNDFSLETDCTVAELLEHHQQSAQLIEQLWEPLCLAALNTSTAQASAEVFLRVLHDSFSHSRRDSDLLIPRHDLGILFPAAAFDFIEQHGGLVHLNQRVSSLMVENDRIAGVSVDDQPIPAREVIVATSPRVSSRLLAHHPALLQHALQIEQLSHEPIVTVYLRYPGECRLELPMEGMSGTVAQWLFDRRVCGQEGVIGAVISGSGPHMELDNQTLSKQIAAELAARHRSWPAPTESLVIREKRATFRCDVGINTRRPGNATALDGLWLAGDYTDTGYPATLEGAVRSGVQCANEIIARRA